MQRLIYTCKRQISLEQTPLIMGILNVTPDSFSDGGKFFDYQTAIDHGIKMSQEGADIIDVGGESTRPGSDRITEEEELQRVIPVIQKLIKEIDKPISIDTYKSKVAEIALTEGAEIVNDISGLNFDPGMARTIAKHKAAVCLMHILGKPKTMQENIEYKSLLHDIASYLKRSISIALKAGIDKESIIIDPGIGFGKTVDHNLYILKNLKFFKKPGYPLLIGTSRKSFIGKILNLEVSERFNGTLAVDAYTAFEGVDIIRTHDVKATRLVIGMINAIKNARLAV